MQLTMHIGRKIERIRELRGIKQESLAMELGVTQQAVSKMELSDTIDDTKLERVAEALGVTADTIRNFREDAAILNFNNFNKENQNHTVFNYDLSASEKIMQLIEANKNLFERMLETERSKVQLLEDLLKSMNKDN